MKRRIIIVIALVLVMVVVMPMITSQLDFGVTIDKDVKAELTTKGINTWAVNNYVGDDEMYRCIVSPNDYNLPCSQRFLTYHIECAVNETYEEVIDNKTVDITIGCLVEERIYYTDSEKDAILDNWEKERMEQIGNAIKDRRTRTEIPKVGALI